MADLCYGDLMERTAGAYPFSPEHLRRVKDVFRRAKNAEAQCLIGPSAECNEKIIGAHSVQKAKLQLIADENNEVYTLNRDEVKSITLMGAEEYTREDEFLHCRVITNSMMTGKWACSDHDKNLFSPIENDNVDLSNEKHCLLLAYRATAVNYFAKRVRRRFSVEIALEFPYINNSPDIVVQTEMLELAMDSHAKAKHALADWENGENSIMDHRHFFIHSLPRIAATLVTTRRRNAVSTQREIETINKMDILVPAMRIPIIVTVYPEKDKTIALLSFPKGWQEFVRVIVPAFWENDERVASALLSKTILEETENIMISPIAWHSFSREKQKRILDQFVVTMPQAVLIRTRNGDPNIPEEDLSDLLYGRDPDFVDNSDPEEFNLFSA